MWWNARLRGINIDVARLDIQIFVGNDAAWAEYGGFFGRERFVARHVMQTAGQHGEAQRTAIQPKGRQGAHQIDNTLVAVRVQAVVGFEPGTVAASSDAPRVDDEIGLKALRAQVLQEQLIVPLFSGADEKRFGILLPIGIPGPGQYSLVADPA